MFSAAGERRPFQHQKRSVEKKHTHTHTNTHTHKTSSHTIFHTQLWQAWHLVTSTFVLRGIGLGLVARLAHWGPLVARDAAALLRGRHSTW